MLGIMAILLSCLKPNPEPPPSGSELVPPDSTWMVGQTLFWTTVDYDSLLKYKVYKGRDSGEYGFPYSVFKPDTSVIFDNLVDQVTYYVAVASVDSAENESAKTTELVFKWGTDTTQEVYDAILEWRMNSEEDLAGYKVYRGTQSGAYGLYYNVNTDTVFYTQLFYNREYFFAVTAYDTANNESEYSEEVSIIIHKQWRLYD